MRNYSACLTRPYQILAKPGLLLLLLLPAMFFACKNEPVKKAVQGNNGGQVTNTVTVKPTAQAPEVAQTATAAPAPVSSSPAPASANTPPPKDQAEKPALEGKLVGHITLENIPLQTEPSQKAAKVSTLKRLERIYILKTIMTNEQGQSTEYPTWYQVMRENKQQGWVTAKAVDVGGGG